MNCYRELFMNYEKKEISNSDNGVDIFFCLRTISMYIACGDFKNANEYIKNLENLFKSNNFYYNMRDGESYSNICDFVFKPIFSGRKFRSLVSNGEYLYSKECHNITSAYLEYFGRKNNNICAVTALIKGLGNKSFFHSFILDNGTNMVYDFANNIVMSKDKYYCLIVMDEVNILNYKNYVSELQKYSNDDKDGLADLLFLGLVELKNREKINFY